MHILVCSLTFRLPLALQIYEVFNYKSNIHLVLEFMEFDLEQVIKVSKC